MAKRSLDKTARCGGLPCGQEQSQVLPRDAYYVLVVDDDSVFREFVRGVLRRHGFNVLTTSSGAMGLEILDSVRGDIRVVLLDYTMPGFAGAETLQYVRETTPAVKVVPLAPFIPQRITSSAGNGTDGDTENSVYTKELIETIDLLAAAATAA